MGIMEINEGSRRINNIKEEEEEEEEDEGEEEEEEEEEGSNSDDEDDDGTMTLPLCPLCEGDLLSLRQ